MAIKIEDIVDVEALERSTEKLRQKIISCSGSSEVIAEAQVRLPRGTILWWAHFLDALESDVDVNAVPGGPELWQRVRNGERGFTEHEFFMINTMLGQTPPEL